MEKDLESLWSDIIDAYNEAKDDTLCRRLQALITEKYDIAELDEMVEGWLDEGDTAWNDEWLHRGRRNRVYALL